MTHLNQVLAHGDEVGGLKDQEANRYTVHQIGFHILEVVTLQILLDQRLHSAVTRHENHDSFQEQIRKRLGQGLP